MKMIYLIKWLLAIGVVALLFGFQLLFPTFPKELIAVGPDPLPEPRMPPGIR